MRSCVEIRGKCPYCEYSWSIEVRDVRGELKALRCFDCREPFVVDVAVTITHTVRALADVDANEVLDGLTTIPTPEQMAAENGAYERELHTDKDLKPPPSMSTLLKRGRSHGPPLRPRPTDG